MNPRNVQPTEVPHRQWLTPDERGSFNQYTALMQRLNVRGSNWNWLLHNEQPEEY